MKPMAFELMTLFGLTSWIAFGWYFGFVNDSGSVIPSAFGMNSESASASLTMFVKLFESQRHFASVSLLMFVNDFGSAIK